MLRANATGNFGGSVAGVDVLEDLLNGGTTRRDGNDQLQPLLAEALPSIENGLWRVLSDGRMETSWNLKKDIQWHDGTPFTTADLQFTVTACSEIEAFCGYGFFDLVEKVTPVDDRRITVTWKQPFIDADSLFTTQFGMPLPRHLLESAYRENKRAMTELPYFNHAFVGTGPFQLRDWVAGSHMTLVAFDHFVLGRPQIDQIVVRFIPDPNTMVANMLSGAVDVNFGRGMSLEQAVEVSERLGANARLEISQVNWLVAWPQFINPQPLAMLDLGFRRGLLYALDRQEMVDTLMAGRSSIAHAYFDTRQPQYRDIDSEVVKYGFDPRQAAQLIESAGYTRGTDGGLREASGQRLSLEIRNTGTQEIQNKAQQSMADYWRRLGISVETVVMGPQRRNDHEYRATRPGFEVSQIPDGVKGLRRAQSSETPLPENNYEKTNNTSRYMNAELDGLIGRFFATIPIRDRVQVLGQILHHTTDQVVTLPLFYGASPTVLSSRLVGVGPRKAQEGTEAWNAYAWDINQS